MAVYETDQQETARELGDLLRLAQAIGRRLESETHGHRYDDVHAVLELLHQARVKMELLQQSLWRSSQSD